MYRPKKEYWQNRHETIGSLFSHQKMADTLLTQYGSRLRKHERQFVKNCYFYDRITNNQKNQLKNILDRCSGKIVSQQQDDGLDREYRQIVCNGY